MDLVGDERGQSVQIGAVLLFAVLIIAFSSYQAFVVPGQNREVDFNHFSDAQADMEEFRNGVIEAGQTGRTVPVDIRLGVTYPARLVAAQSSGSGGSLRTTRIGDASNTIELQNTDETMADVCGVATPTTRAATYDPDYSYLNSVGNITYENTVVYTSGRSGGRAFQTDQQLIDGSTIHLYPLVGEYNEGGRGTATVTLNGGATGVNSSVTQATSGGVDLILPTRLSASQWQTLLSDQTNVDAVSDVSGRAAVRIELAAGVTYEVRCSPAGAGSAPNNAPTVGGDDGSGSINPNFGSDVVLESVSAVDENTVNLRLRNTNENEYQNITSIRFPFYSATTTNNAGTALPDSLVVDDTIVERGGQLQSVRIDFSPGETREIPVDFYCTVGAADSYAISDGDFFVFTSFFGADKERTYFAALDDVGNAPNTRCDGSNDYSGGGSSGGSGGGSDSFSAVNATDLPKNVGDGSATQTLSFTLDGNLESGETVTIDLSDAQGGTTTSPNDVAYQDATIDGGGSATITTPTDTDFVIQYQNSGSDVSDGSTITIELTTIYTDNGNFGPFDVVFSRSDGASSTATFGST